MSYAIKQCLIAGLVSIGLLTIGADRAFAGGYFSAGKPGGLGSALSYALAQTPANQAWAKYTAQNRQVQVPNVSTGTYARLSRHAPATRTCPSLGLSTTALSVHRDSPCRMVGLLLPRSMLWAEAEQSDTKTLLTRMGLSWGGGCGHDRC
jgi:hypothetical protein